MKLCKRSILISSIVVLLLLSSMIVSAEEITDGNNDVYHHTYSENEWSWILSSENKPNIDIKKVSYSVSGNTLTATLEVNGAIQDSKKVAYVLNYNTTDAAYMFTYTDGQGFAMGMLIAGGFNPSFGEFTASGNTLTGTIDLLGESTVEDVWGLAAEYSVDPTTVEDPNVVEWWGDWIPGAIAPWFTGEDTDGDEDTGGEETNGDTDGGTGGDEKSTGTPGFEAIAFIAALAISFILLSKKK